MNNKDILQLAETFEKQAQAGNDTALIDSIVATVQHASQSLSTGAASVAAFQQALAPLLQAKRNWNNINPQNKLQLINSVFQQYTDLPQSYMDPTNFRPVPLRDNISKLFSRLVSRYRG